MPDYSQPLRNFELASVDAYKAQKFEEDLVVSRSRIAALEQLLEQKTALLMDGKQDLAELHYKIKLLESDKTALEKRCADVIYILFLSC